MKPHEVEGVLCIFKGELKEKSALVQVGPFEAELVQLAMTSKNDHLQARVVVRRRSCLSPLADF
jgi:hypothetical protein